MPEWNIPCSPFQNSRLCRTEMLSLLLLRLSFALHMHLCSLPKKNFSFFKLCLLSSVSSSGRSSNMSYMRSVELSLWTRLPQDTLPGALSSAGAVCWEKHQLSCSVPRRTILTSADNSLKYMTCHSWMSPTLCFLSGKEGTSHKGGGMIHTVGVFRNVQVAPSCPKSHNYFNKIKIDSLQGIELPSFLPSCLFWFIKRRREEVGRNFRGLGSWAILWKVWVMLFQLHVHILPLPLVSPQEEVQVESGTQGEQVWEVFPLGPDGEIVWWCPQP